MAAKEKQQAFVVWDLLLSFIGFIVEQKDLIQFYQPTFFNIFKVCLKLQNMGPPHPSLINPVDALESMESVYMIVSIIYLQYSVQSLFWDPYIFSYHPYCIHRTPKGGLQTKKSKTFNFFQKGGGVSQKVYFLKMYTE